MKTIRPVIVLFLIVASLHFNGCANNQSLLALPTVSPVPSSTSFLTSTPTLRPSPTPIPSTPTETLYERPASNGPALKAQAAKGIVVDGDLEDWSGFPCYALDQSEQVKYGVENWQGVQDLSGGFCLANDGQALYLSFQVTDDKIVQYFSNSDLWQGDYIEVWLDTDLAGDFNEASPNVDDFQLGISPGNFDDVPSTVIVWMPQDFPAERVKTVQYAFKRTENGYRGEVRIPWAFFGDVIQLEDRHLGINIAFSDNDQDVPKQETMIAIAPEAVLHWGDPTYWVNLYLADADFTMEPLPTFTIERLTLSLTGRELQVLSIFTGDPAQLNAHHLYVDLDQKSDTGFQVGEIGAEFMVENEGVFAYTGDGTSWSWRNVGKANKFAVVDNTASWTLDLNVIGMIGDQTATFVSQLVDKDWSPIAISKPLVVDLSLGKTFSTGE